MRRAPLRNDREALSNGIQSGVDIDDQKVAENALQRSEAIGSKRRSSVSPAVFLGSPSATKHFWSDETYQIMGFDWASTTWRI